MAPHKADDTSFPAGLALFAALVVASAQAFLQAGTERSRLLSLPDGQASASLRGLATDQERMMVVAGATFVALILVLLGLLLARNGANDYITYLIPGLAGIGIGIAGVLVRPESQGDLVPLLLAVSAIFTVGTFAWLAIRDGRRWMKNR